MNKKTRYKVCFILYAISSALFFISAALNFSTYGFTQWIGFTNLAVGIVFGSLSFIYFKKYKEFKEEK